MLQCVLLPVGTCVVNGFQLAMVSTPHRVFTPMPRLFGLAMRLFGLVMSLLGIVMHYRAGCMGHESRLLACSVLTLGLLEPLWSLLCLPVSRAVAARACVRRRATGPPEADVQSGMEGRAKGHPRLHVGGDPRRRNGKRTSFALRPLASLIFHG